MGYEGYFSIRGGFCFNAGAVNMPTPSTNSNIKTGLTTEKIIQNGNESTVMRQLDRISAPGNHYRLPLLKVLRSQTTLFTPCVVSAQPVLFRGAINGERTLYVVFSF